MVLLTVGVFVCYNVSMKIFKAGLAISLLVFAFPLNVFAQTNLNAIVEDAVRFYFADAPVMVDVARCETKFKQYNADGSAYYDASRTYIGTFQISEKIHTPRATSMGLNLATLDGNLGYARYLYDTSGTNPWKGCLPKNNTAPSPSPTPPTTNGAITSNLRMGMTNSQVMLVQQILNRNGFVIAASGGGSIGQETNYFGSLTREAVKKFQCAKGLVCEGNEATTGYGRVGPNTRALLNSL
jgi:hypothetical protein